MVQNTVPPQARIFDRRLLRDRRGRAAGELHAHDFLLTEIAERLADRLSDIARRFPAGARSRRARRHPGAHAAGPRRDRNPDPVGCFAGQRATAGELVADEELLPFKEQSFDAILSNLSLHWVNDLPGALAQIRSSLKPDGLFLASLFGTGTLQELRTALMEAELAETGGASPRVSPFADLRDAAGLLQRAGFALPVADADTVTVTYGDFFALLRDLRGMGETNILLDRLKQPTRRTVFARAAAIYQERFADAQGRLPATFQILFLTGWAPDPSQQQPAKRGSGKASLKDVFRT